MADNTPATPRRVSVLGSTGSIGVNTLDLIDFTNTRSDSQIEVVALTANQNIDLLVEQARKFRPEVVVTADETRGEELKDLLAGTGIEVASGAQAIIEAATREADWVMAAIVGAAGLEPTLAAARKGVDIALANKECLVCAGDVVTQAVRDSGSRLLPVDSEHNAIFQVYDFERPERISRLILTASGGPFRTWAKEDMATATPAQAVAHPNWSMGAKISVDSATMMNKGLELIEAAHLFPTPHDRIEMLVHPQSVIHSMVEYVDGSVLAQLGTPDMRTPIAACLAWPDRVESPSAKLDFHELGALTFEKPDPERFPLTQLARDALQRGGVFPAILNAANEIAVESFLGDRLDFAGISAVVAVTLDAAEKRNAPATLECLDDALEADAFGRRLATEAVTNRAA
ncbi:MAG: 1-deoxy-D-xylulose-5-phosphate reductoisomerase [Pseudomonadota bacterium]